MPSFYSPEFGEDELVEGDVLFRRLDGHGAVDLRGDAQGDVAAEFLFAQGHGNLFSFVPQPFQHTRHSYPGLV